MANQLTGIHHLTAITSSAPKMFDFMSGVMGLHLIKKTVNQDDVRTYHLYFTDDQGSAGTDITFFDFPGIPRAFHGNNEIAKTSFRVPSDEALSYWEQRFDQFRITYHAREQRFGSWVLPFEDFDGQLYELISDANNHGVPAGTPWQHSTVDPQYAIGGLGPEYIVTSQFERLEAVMQELLGFKFVAQDGQYHLFELNGGGHGAQVIVDHQLFLPPATQGFGGVHHLAFRTDDQESLQHWIDLIGEKGFQSSGFVDRFYFASEYFRPIPEVLFEIATDGPGFLVDETYEEAGIHLELPPFLEQYRDQIEAGLVPFNTGE